MNTLRLVILSIPLRDPRLTESEDIRPGTPADVVVRTPAEERHFTVSFLNIPWFSFQDEVLNSILWGARQANDRPAPETSPLMLRNIEDGANVPLKGSAWDILGGHSRDLLPSAAQLHSMIIGDQEDDPISLRQYHWTLSSALTGLDLVRATIFLSSNNMFDSRQMDKFLWWIEDINGQWLLKSVLSTQTLATEIFTNNLLKSASKIGNLEAIRSLLKLKVNATVREEFLRTAMSEATMNGNISLVEILLDGGAEVNPRQEFDFECTPLGHAIELWRHTKLPYMLLNAEAPLDKWSYRHGTALQIAAAKNHTALVWILLDKGFNVDAPSGMSVTCEHIESRYRDTCDAFISPLVHAVRNGNLVLVKALLERGADINLCPSHQHKQFFLVYTKHRHEELEFGERRREMIDQTMHTALETAVYQENLEVVEFLLNAGARTDQHQCGNSALAIAAQRNNVTLTRLLLNHGAKLNAPTSWPFGRTAVQAASENGNRILLELLLSSITDVPTGFASIEASPSPYGGRTALQAAAEQGHVNVIRYLLTLGVNIDGPVAENFGLSTLQAAVESNSLHVVSFVLAAGADTSTPLGTNSALNLAIYQNDLPMLLLLLKHDLDVNARPADGGESPLQAAISPRIHETNMILDILIRAGADVNAYWSFAAYGTALRKAVYCRNYEAVQLLLQAGADVNGPEEYIHEEQGAAMSAIHQAAFSHDGRLINLLLRYGADPNAIHGADGCNALASAMGSWKWRDDELELSSTETIQLLLKAGAHVNGRSTKGYHDMDEPQHMQTSILGAAAASMGPEVVKIMLASGADPNWRHSLEDSTALQSAVLSDDEEIVHTILEAGADINAPASLKDGRTALQQAASRGNMHIVRLLLQKGADVNAPPSQVCGVTALQAASIQGHLAIVILLLHADADINAEASAVEGRTALEGAAERGRLDMVQLLLDNDHDSEGFYDRCENAACYADKEGHFVIARMLRNYRKD